MQQFDIRSLILWNIGFCVLGHFRLHIVFVCLVSHLLPVIRKECCELKRIHMGMEKRSRIVLNIFVIYDSIDVISITRIRADLQSFNQQRIAHDINEQNIVTFWFSVIFSFIIIDFPSSSFFFLYFFSPPIWKCSEREASVMFANSWLYHYYSVQSKIQFGIPYEGPTRAPSTTAYFGHHHSPTLQSPGLGHPYATPHHHMSYGYHSPVGIAPHQSSPGNVGHHHHNGNGPPLNHHNSSDHYRPYAYRIDAQTTDFSPIALSIPHQIEPRCGSANSLSNGSNHLGSPPSKRRAIARLEPLYIPEPQETSSTVISDTSVGDITTAYATSHGSNGSDGGVGNSGGTALMTAVVALPRHRVHSKAMPMETPDFMDQWNPSPPWSETTQKVPDPQQELSPYLARTPPTPTSASPIHSNGGGPAFSFDWMSEQFVSIMDYSSHHGLSVHDGQVAMQTVLPPSTAIPVQMQLQMTPWPIAADHKLITMHADKRPEEELVDQRRSHWFCITHINAVYVLLLLFSIFVFHAIIFYEYRIRSQYIPYELLTPTINNNQSIILFGGAEEWTRIH